MKKSFRQLNQFSQPAIGYMSRHHKEGATNKMGYALKRVVTQIQAAGTKFNEEIAEVFDGIRLDNCLTDPPNDPNGKVLRSAAGAYEFSKEGERTCKKKMKEAQDKALDREDVEITPHFVSQVPDDLTDEELTAFSGYVIKPEVVESMLKAREESEGETPSNGHVPASSVAAEAAASGT